MAEVGVTRLRRELKDWLDRAQAGEEVVVTDRGRPIARLNGVVTAPILEQLVRDGRVSPSSGAPRTTATGRSRVSVDQDVSDLIVAERDERR